MAPAIRLHASCVAIGEHGLLLLGEPRAGKSDLSLRLIDRGAKLVADDQVELVKKGRQIIASCPRSIHGLIEVRGVGIFKLPARKQAPLLLVVQLSQREWIERLPFPDPYECLGARIQQMRICAHEDSAVIKVEMAMKALQDTSMTVGAFKE